MEERDSSSSSDSSVRCSQWKIIKSRLLAVIKCKASNHSDLAPMAPMTKEDESLDWLYITIITLVVNCMDKVFDLLFILELAHESEWIFISLSICFMVIATFVTSLFAAQSFWVQSSTIPGWSSAWVMDVPKKRKAFLEDHLYTPINRRIVPHESQFRVKQSIPDSHETLAKSHSEVEKKAIFTITGELNSSTAKGSSRSRQLSGKQRNAHSSLPAVDSHLHGTSVVQDGQHHSDLTSSSLTLTVPDPSNFIEIKPPPVPDESDGGVASEGAADTAGETDFNQGKFEKQFRPWVRYLVVFLFCTGLLPEWVLMVNLSMYAGAGEDKRLISCLLRDTWYVQTVKLSQALLESIPQIHIKVFYFLTQHSGALPLGQVIGVVVSGISIAVGLIEPFHVQIGYKVVGFILIFFNLCTRISVSAALNQITTDGIYFVPYACALVVSVSVTAFITIIRRGDYRRGESRLDKYVNVPIMRTFCTPPADRTGALVALVFIGAAAVSCGLYAEADQALAAAIVVVVAVLGQGITGLVWYAVGISQINAENKKRRRDRLVQEQRNSVALAQQRF